MNDFLRYYARQSYELGGAKNFLAIDSADGETILGFYSLAPGAVTYADAPETLRRGLAKHDVPGFRLARLATNLSFQGQGLGRSVPSAALPNSYHRVDVFDAGRKGLRVELLLDRWADLGPTGILMVNKRHITASELVKLQVRANARYRFTGCTKTLI